MPDKAGRSLDRILAHLARKGQNAPVLPHLARMVAYFRSGMNGYIWHAQHSEQGFWINERKLVQISKASRQNQRGGLLSTGA